MKRRHPGDGPSQKTGENPFELFDVSQAMLQGLKTIVLSMQKALGAAIMLGSDRNSSRA